MNLDKRCVPSIPLEVDGEPETFHELNDVRNSIAGRIENWMKQEADNLFICIDGMPGSGKSTLTNVVNELLREVDLQAFVYQRDWFTGTERGSKDRLEMTYTDDAARFFELYYKRSELMNLAMALAKRKEGFDYNTDYFYNRLTGKFQPAIINVPDIRRIVCFEGVGSMELMDTALKLVGEEVRARCGVVNCFVEADKSIAINDAVGRQSDDLEARRFQYEREYEMLSGYVYPWKRVADIVFDTTVARALAG